MRVVEVGQNFVTKDTGDCRQFQSVACREYTLPRDDRASQPKGWIQGNMRIGTVLEVTTSFQHFKYGIELRIKYVNQDDSHSWVRISYGTVKYVTDSIEDNTENPADSQEEEGVQTSSSVVAARSKAKIKPQPRESTGMTTIPLRERKWIDIEPSKQNIASYDLSKKVVNLLRHNQTLQREEDRAMNSARKNFFFEIIIHKYRIGVMIDGKLVWLQEEDRNEDISIALMIREQFSTSVLFKDILEAISFFDPTSQDNVMIGTGIFHYIYHVGSNFNLHSIIRNGLVPGGQNLSRRQTVFFLPVDPRNECHRDPEYIDFSVPRLARTSRRVLLGRY